MVVSCNHLQVKKNGKYTVDVRVLLYIIPVRRLVTKYRELIIGKSPDTLF